ncbi:MAG: hypothetical protein MUP82_03705, partial [Candidatus Marinimicrobia bacterium]|nr:hypothetical protein [Candidatus Neomarinimicrobiota bacterium]
MVSEYTAEQGCKSSKADAKHDFHGIFDKDNLDGYVTSNIPTNGVGCDTLGEDAFIDDQLLTPGSRSSENKTNPAYVAVNLNTNISGRYTATYIERPQHKFDDPYNKSLLQEHFQKNNILDDVYFVCDVAYANVREDLKFADLNKPQKFYWVQNAQTLYDPAGKTSWHSDKAYFDSSETVEIQGDGQTDVASSTEEDTKDKAAVGRKSRPGLKETAIVTESSLQPKLKASSPGSKASSSTSGKTESQNHFKKDTSQFVFCWQNAGLDKIIPYPIWSGTKPYSFSQDVPEQMLYTNKNLYLGIRSTNVEDYSTHEAYLIITDPTKPRYFGFSDKVLSAKGSGILKGADLASYRAKGEGLKRFVKFVDTRLNTTSNSKLVLDEVMDYSPELQVLSKKTGDASQSLSCCNKQFNLQRFKRNSAGLAGGVDNFVSNGNHAFVSFDRIAWASALNYNCPIVIANTQDGFTVYIRNDLLDVKKQIASFFDTAIDVPPPPVATDVPLVEGATDVPPPPADILKYKFLAPLTEEDGFILVKQYGVLPELAGKAIASFRQACTNLNIDIVAENDTTYQHFLTAHFLELNAFNLFLNIDKSVLQFAPEMYNHKVKQLYETNRDLFNKIVQPDMALDSIEDKTDVMDIIRNVSTNIYKTIGQLKTLYDGVELGPGDVKLKYTPILMALKQLQAIIIGITEIQKELALSITSMKALTNYQDKIGAINLETFEENFRLLPKGVASNIKSCTPYKYCIVNSKPVRTTDILFERSTSVFGTTTVILQIFNTLNNGTFGQMRDLFMNKLYDLLDNLIVVSGTINNISFAAIVGAAKKYMTDNFLDRPGDVRTIDDIISQLLQLKVATASASASLEAPLLKSRPLEAPLLKLATSAEDETLSVEELDDMRKIFKQKDLLIPEGVTSAVNFSEKIHIIRDSIQDIEATIEEVLNGKQTDTDLVKSIQTAYEADTFVKGFIGILIFMAYTKYQEDKKVPVILSKREGVTQDMMAKNLFKLLYQNLDAEKPDDSDAAICLKEIQTMVPGFVLEEYTQATDKQAYILSTLKPTMEDHDLRDPPRWIRRVNRKIKDMIPKIEKIIAYYESTRNRQVIETTKEDPVFIVES